MQLWFLSLYFQIFWNLILKNALNIKILDFVIVQSTNSLYNLELNHLSLFYESTTLFTILFIKQK